MNHDYELEKQLHPENFENYKSDEQDPISFVDTYEERDN